MDRLMEYNGYHAKFTYDAEKDAFVGEIVDVNDGALDFYARSVDGLREGFKVCLDEYIKACQKKGIKPEKEYNGVFNVRVPSDIHRKASIAAAKRGITLNQFVSEAIAKAVKQR